MSILIEQLQGKSRNLFFRFLLLIQSSWRQIDRKNHSSDDILNVSIDVLSTSILHEHFDRNQRHAFLLNCLTEDKSI